MSAISRLNPSEIAELVLAYSECASTENGEAREIIEHQIHSGKINEELENLRKGQADIGAASISAEKTDRIATSVRSANTHQQNGESNLVFVGCDRVMVLPPGTNDSNKADRIQAINERSARRRQLETCIQLLFVAVMGFIWWSDCAK
jgi:hypothetical protein